MLSHLFSVKKIFRHLITLAPLSYFLFLAPVITANNDAQLQPPVKIIAVTEELYPHSYTDPLTGHISGFGPDLARALSDSVGIPLEMYTMTWPKAYNMAINLPNILIFPITLTDNRAPRFHWLGELTSSKTALYQLSGRKIMPLQTLADAKRYRVGAVDKDYFFDLLSKQGFIRGKNLIEVSSADHGLKMLIAGRIDFIIRSDDNFDEELKRFGLPRKQFKKNYNIKEHRSSMYIALSKKTRKETVNRFKAALETLIQSGQFDAIKKANSSKHSQ